MLVSVLGLTAVRFQHRPFASLSRSGASPRAALQGSEALSYGARADGMPTYNNTWYAVAYTEQLQPDSTFATRLWGEPVVLYRDVDGQPVCVRDACPHRSAPLSMGDVKDGVLRCFYHGWGFGAEGKCVNVPTMGCAGKTPSGSDAGALATVELDGMLWVWRGHILTADATKLPRQVATEHTVTVDTTLDYDCEWTDVMESSLASPLLTSLLSQNGGAGEADAVFHGPNVVRHCDARFSEEVHAVPIAPKRTRTMLRQRFTKGPALSAVLQLPGALSVLTWLVRNWNYHVAREGYVAMRRQLHDGDPTASAQQLAPDSDLLERFRQWNREALEAVGQPYFNRWDGGERPRYGPQIDDTDAGTFGLKKTYVQNNPAVVYAPMHP